MTSYGWRSYGGGLTVSRRSFGRLFLLATWLIFSMAVVTHASVEPVNPSESGDLGEFILTSHTESVEISDPLPTYSPPAHSSPSIREIHQLVHFDVATFHDSVDPGQDTHWHRLRFTGDFSKAENREFVLSLINPIINHLTVYLLNEKGTLVKQQSFGLLDESYSAKQAVSAQAFSFTIENGETLYVYIKKQSVSPAILLIQLNSQTAYQQQVLNRYLFWGGIIAFLVGLAIYNSAVYALSKSVSYLWYLAFYAVSFFYFSGMHGYGVLLWPERMYQWIATHMMTLNFVLGWLIVHFTVSFLNAKNNAPRHYPWVKWVDGVFATGFVASFIWYEYQLIPALSVIQLLVSVYLIWMAISAYKNGFYPARFFLLSWSFIIVGASVGLATYAGQLPVNFYTMHAFFLGSVGELLFFSIALADRLKYTEYMAVTQAYIDPRTNQPNLSYFKSKRFQLPQTLLKKNQKLAIVLIQLEGIKNLLGLLGPAKMEEAYGIKIKRFEQFLKDKPWIIFYRLGRKDVRYMVTLPGNQLLIIVKYENNISDIVEELKQISLNSLRIENIETRFTFKVGIADLPTPKNDASEISFDTIYEAYRQAQLALIFCEKEQQTQLFYSSDQDEKMRQQVVLLTDLRHAIADSDFVIHIQPQFSAQQGLLVGGEVLVRWQHQEKGMIPPFQFIPLAEQTDNIYPITKIVIEKAMQWLQQFLAEHPRFMDSFQLSINLSAHDIYRDDLIDFISRKTRQYDATPQTLKFEMTESAVMRDHQRFMEVISELHAMGYGIALDDFGTGYSSMSYIQKMKADEIKIDRSFVSNIHTVDINRKIVRAIIQIAESTNAITVAEGVETEEELAVMKELGADCIQGFLLGKPVPAEAFASSFAGE